MKFWFALADITVIAILAAEAVLAIGLLSYGVYTLFVGSVGTGLLFIGSATAAAWLGLLSANPLYVLSEGLLTLVMRRAEQAERSQTSRDDSVTPVPSPNTTVDEGSVFDAGATTSAVEYLDQCLKHAAPATLVGMLGYVDYHRRVVPTLEEINEALGQRAAIRAHRENRSVLFVQEGPVRTITEEDLNHAYSEYRRTFTEGSRKRKQ